MSKKLTFNQWRKNWLNMGCVVIVCGAIALLIGIFNGYGIFLNLSALFLVLLG